VRHSFSPFWLYINPSLARTYVHVYDTLDRTYRRAEPYNWTTFGEYSKKANAPALPETLRLYKRLQALGIKPVILTGRREDKREASVKNLARAGYTGYLKLLLKYIRRLIFDYLPGLFPSRA
jgi:phosphoglycolate phosphatase-like HAD superfamily hydrolase